MYVHFRCLPPCQKIYAIRTNNPLKEVPPTCRACTKVTRLSGTGAQRLRKGAIELTPAASGRTVRSNALEKLRNRKRDEEIMERRLRAAAELDEAEDSSESDDEDDPDFLPPKSHDYNIQMRLTTSPYAARATYGHDATHLQNKRNQILGTAGRLNLNKVMGDFLGAPDPGRYAAWKHTGAPKYSDNKVASSEWCHLIADSLGGPSVPGNLVAASYCANTYMAAIEVLLKGQSGLTLDVTVHCSAPHIGEWIHYKIVDTANPAHFYDVSIDALAAGFNGTDLDRVQLALQAWLRGRGIVVHLPA